LALTAGIRLGVYEITAQIGEGGMGQVYRARDTKLGRDVALKILPEALAHDVERLARFQREAKTLASLNHPNIGAIDGLEESGGMTALVMELVEGDDLSQRIARGAIPLDEALGQPEVYVLSREGGGKVPLSTGGGTFPRWRRDGRDILYLPPDQKLMSIAVSGSGRTFQAGATTSLFTMNVQPGAGTPFDVTADGQRFIVNAKIPSRFPPSLNVVVNWPALLPKP
jgi:Protein kinase domain